MRSLRPIIRRNVKINAKIIAVGTQLMQLVKESMKKQKQNKKKNKKKQQQQKKTVPKQNYITRITNKSS